MIAKGYSLTNCQKNLLEYSKQNLIIHIYFYAYGEMGVAIVPADAKDILASVGYSPNLVMEYFGIKSEVQHGWCFFIDSENALTDAVMLLRNAFENQIFKLLDQLDDESLGKLHALAKHKQKIYNERFSGKASGPTQHE